MEAWRVIQDGPHDGPTNMAIDHAILDAVIAGAAPPTLRLYAWAQPTLSLGIGQSAADFSPERLLAHGVALVRRPTGGRAVLHAVELTYSLALPPGHPLGAGTILDSYRRISAGLIAGLYRLGVTADPPRALTARPLLDTPVCFEIASDYEITVNGRKLIGSAQMRRSGGVLQHGSLPLTGDPAAICALIAYDTADGLSRARAALHAHATTLAEATHFPGDRQDIVAAVIAGCADTFSITPIRAALSDAEWAAAETIRAARYAADAWTYRR